MAGQGAGKNAGKVFSSGGLADSSRAAGEIIRKTCDEMLSGY